MKYLPIWGLALLFFSGCAQLTLRTATEESFVLESAQTGQTYAFTVLLPPAYDESRSYPSVYLIDGHWHYLHVASDAKRLMEQEKIEDIILIGIAYEGLPPNTLGGYGTISELRIDDLTSVKNREAEELGGKSDAFRDFMRDDLIPEVESRYATDAVGRTLMGHSLGGYFGIWEMLTFPDNSLYDNIHAGSPALWWGDGFLMGEEERVHEAGTTLPFDFHTDMGTLESVVWNAFFDEFEERLEEHAHPGLTYQFDRFAKGHAANAETGFREALIYFFGN